MKDSAIKVMIVDDHTLVRRGTAALLAAEPDIEVVGSAANTAECLNQLPDSQPDVVLLDIFLPDGSGIDVIAKIKELLPGSHIVMLTGEEPKSRVEAALLQGASGFLLKDCLPEEMFAAIRKAARNETHFPEHLLARMSAGAEQEEAAMFQQRIRISASLTAREKQILMFLAKGKRNQEIADELTLSKRTVEGHVLKLLDKLGFQTRNEAAAFYVGMRDKRDFQDEA
ncbi:MAG: response regulator transcription factor [Peptococcaceae bacterium]|jgi:DNA-binding NarL/FixJ family response regulator|nr:response regulator transcription factor [Peptococcaceae bacterium]